MKSELRAEYHPVLILGAGPAGLSVAYELARRGIEALILERGPAAGHSFANFPRNIYFGPWLNNLLPGSRVSWSWLLRRSTQPTYAWYLAEFARQNQLPLQTDTTVESVQREDGRFVVNTDRGRFWSRLVINATGYFSKPFIPAYPGAAKAISEGRAIHVADYRDADTVRERIGRGSGRVLIVGKRLSAGETMCELHRQGFQVSLSHRGTLKIGPSPWMEALLSPIMWIREQASVRLRLKLDSYPYMAGGESRAYLKSGQVPVYPDIVSIQDDTVLFEDGRRERFDLIVFATGYRPAVNHLQNLLQDAEHSGTRSAESVVSPRLKGMESAAVPGLFFLGLDNQRTFRSRFLRGITEDSKIMADLVARKLASMTPIAQSQRIVVPSEVLIDLDESPSEIRDTVTG